MYNIYAPTRQLYSIYNLKVTNVYCCLLDSTKTVRITCFYRDFIVFKYSVLNGFCSCFLKYTRVIIKILFKSVLYNTEKIEGAINHDSIQLLVVLQVQFCLSSVRLYYDIIVSRYFEHAVYRLYCPVLPQLRLIP